MSLQTKDGFELTVGGSYLKMLPLQEECNSVGRCYFKSYLAMQGCEI